MKTLELRSISRFVTLSLNDPLFSNAPDKFWVEDPDGNRWEVFVFHEDVETNDPQYQPAAVADATACCGPNS